MKKGIMTTLALGIFLAQTSLSAADIYFYKDPSDSAIYFSDVRLNSAYKPFYPAKHMKIRDAYKSGKSVKGNSALREHIRKASERFEIDPKLIESIIRVESNFDPGAISPAGAIGLMQLMPETAMEMGVEDPKDPFQNVMGGTKYLRQLLETFGGSTKLALAAYNAGPTPVKFYGKVPPFPETQDYVKKVMANHVEKFQGKTRIYRKTLKDGTLLLTDRP
jgi:soluble lytic murein transglycosylase-like protein